MTSMFVCLILLICALSSTSFLLSKAANKYLTYNRDSKNPNNQIEPSSKRKMSLPQLIQLVLMGAGAPGLGEFDRVDPETGKIFFKLEANNLFDNNVCKTNLIVYARIIFAFLGRKSANKSKIF